jgi:hypothetical protein
VNKQGARSIGLTFDRSAAEVRPEKIPAMAGVRQWHRGRRGLDSGVMWARLSHRARVEAHVGARDELGVVGWSRARAEKRVHRRR